jgi:transmembrane sensor
MTPEELIILQEKFFAGTCSAEEIEQLRSYEDDFQLLEEASWKPELGDENQIKHQLLKNLHQAMDKPEKAASQSRYYYAAAAVFVLAMFGLMFYPKQEEAVPKLTNSKTAKPFSIIKPGSNKAILTLSNGTVINLSDAQAGLVSRQGNIRVGKAADGLLVYQGKANKKQPVIFNTVTTPRGGQYQIVLPDGTKVWLNAASSLKFPSIFSAAERSVELQGEAYFEVAKNKHQPFKVAVKQMNIEVLGTYFNVNAYADEASIKTTLLEGSVKLSSGNNHKILAPGQQASLGHKPGFQIKAVNVEEAVAWKNGYFIFDNENIQDIMRKVARWYDVEVVYQGKIDKGSYGGTVSRFNSVTGVLKSLELTGTVHFKTEGRRITVMP